VLGSQLEVDMFLPEIKTAIEIDGPSHFRPIWGEDKLQKQQNADTVKQGLILGQGFTILRIRQYDRNISITRMNFILQCIIEQLKEIEAGDGKPRLIEIEVKDGKAKRI
jgi:very-short-patch-repair endonuclease